MDSIPKIDIPKKATYVHVTNDVDFFALFRAIEKKYETCYILESLGGDEKTSRYEVIGFNPQHIIRAKDKNLVIDDTAYQVENPYETLCEIVPQDCIARLYAGGLVGYMSYEAVNYFEPTLNVQVHEDFDQFMFGVYTDGLVHDTQTNELYYFYYSENRIEEVRALINTVVEPGALSVQYEGDSMTQEEHRAAVETVQEYIRSGHTFQCEVGMKSTYTIEGDTVEIYRVLREVNPSPHMYYFKFGDKKIIGASPELLLSLRDGAIETHPLAGTIGRGKTEEEDRMLARTLLNDPKEAAEHKMLVDMHRNDVGKVSRFGTVKIRNYMDVVKYPFVQHICTEIAGILRADEDMFSALAALMPGGVLSGAPKIESIKIIDEMEPEARGPYGGAVGYFGFNGDCTFPIPIRTLFISGNKAYTQTCSGIVLDSDPEAEYEEVEKKLAGMKKTLAQFV